jgi:hypothetical protein
MPHGLRCWTSAAWTQGTTPCKIGRLQMYPCKHLVPQRELLDLNEDVDFILERPDSSRNITCYGECYHTVVQNDTCDSIANGYGVAYDRFVYQNGLDWNCNSLVVGREVCVGSSCSLYVVRLPRPCPSSLRLWGNP